MGVAQAMYSAVTGLSTNADGMTVIANNIANANAKGFKRDRAEFEDLISSDLSSGSGATQIGRGSRLRNIKTMFTQGGMQVTDSVTDIAIQGNGFFVIANPNTEVQESAGKFYSRVGSLQFDRDGFLSDSNGGRVQGYMADGKGVLSTRLTDVRIPSGQIPPQATTKLTINVNLDARSEIKKEPFDIAKPEESSNFSNTQTVFDSHGRSHQCTVFYRKAQDSLDGSTWEWHATVDGKETVDPGETQLKEFASGTVSFDSSGNLLKEVIEKSDVTFNKGARPGQKIEFDFGNNIVDEGGKGVGSSTCISSNSNTIFHKQDGFESGNLKAIKIGLDGVVTGVFTNGIQRDISAIALATFESEAGLEKAGRNQFYQTISSGPPKIGMAQSGSRGSLYASALEESNVDLASEFVQMILTQRSFQANSRSVTTTDSMMEEIINLKR